MLQRLPVARPRPNGAEFIDIVMGRSASSRVPLVEYLVDDVVMEPVVTGVLGRQRVRAAGDRESERGYLDNFIAFWQAMGYDFVRYERGLGFARNVTVAPDVSPRPERNRAWADEHAGAITNWDDFESYHWPTLEEADFFGIEYLSKHLPEGMGLITCHAAGIFEHVSQIMSLEGLAFALHDNRQLVQAVADRVGELMMGYYEHMLDLDNVIAIFQGDDMGFRTGTLISPRDLRAIFLPWLGRLSAAVHARGLPYFLHSCGNLATIMGTLIEDVGIDAKHSFEDAIMPVEEFQTLYGDRIGVLGGLDINILSGAPPEQVRERTRRLVATCGARGRYAVGSGNSVPSYVPVENYLAMVDEALVVGGGA
ncbi:MAG: hypothetical protein GX601_13060 [Anaerolineales bacterium]|nr:hypothetical protein [Anaerolineales bacterium]